MFRRERSATRRARPAHSTGRLVVLLVGVSAVALLVLWLANAHHPATSDAAAFARDIGIALASGVVVVILIEYYTSARLREELSRDVTDAIYGKSTPEPVFDQVRDAVFLSDVCRTNWRYDLTVLSRADGQHESTYDALRRQLGEQASGIFVVEATASYNLKNTRTRRLKEYVVRGGIDLDMPRSAGEETFPRFMEVVVNDATFHIGPEDAERSLAATGSSEHIVLDSRGETELALRVEDQQLRFATRRDLPGRTDGAIAVQYTLRRLVRVPGIYVLSAPVPTSTGITIDITNCAELLPHVSALHPDAAALIRGNGNEWKMSRGILPWQGFTVRFELSARPRPDYVEGG
jgi:hypothetical protein